MAQDHMDIRRPKQKVKREIKRSNIALDDYMFDRKMQSLYYGRKPISDDTPLLVKKLKGAYWRIKTWLQTLPKTIPKTFARLKSSVRKYPARYLVATLALCLVTVFMVAQVGRTLNRRADSVASKDKTSTSTAASQPVESSRIPLNQTPEFLVELPEGKTAQDVGGWAKVSPPNAPAAYAYKDKIGDVNILVSEQALPEGFKTDTGAQVEKLAVGFNATQSVKTEKVQFFVGSNSDGEQSVITYTKTLLIFLKSSAKITNERWQTYIEDLK